MIWNLHLLELLAKTGNTPYPKLFLHKTQTLNCRIGIERKLFLPSNFEFNGLKKLNKFLEAIFFMRPECHWMKTLWKIVFNQGVSTRSDNTLK